MRAHLEQRTGLAKLAAMIPQDAVVIEIGSFLGESTEIFLETKRVRRIYCIDPYRGGYDDSDVASHVAMDDVKAAFYERMKPYGEAVVPMHLSSERAAQFFKAGSADMVYVDGCHLYEAVKRDIALYRPKVKAGGMIAGHDFDQEQVARAVRESFAERAEPMTFEDSSWMMRV
jgi:predicted O-methyltransferase YrrM